jgi:hypothetical protein
LNHRICTFVSSAVVADDSWIAAHPEKNLADILLLRVLRDVVHFEILVADFVNLMFFAEMT